MLTANPDDTFVVLIRHMERYRSWHFLLHQVEAAPGRIVLRSTDINVEIVFIESVEDNLDVACHASVSLSRYRVGSPTLPHDLINLPVLLPTHKLLVLVGELNFDTNLILRFLDKWNA